MPTSLKLPSPNLDGIVLPKVDNAGDLDFVQSLMEKMESKGVSERPPKPRTIVACIESAAAVTNLRSICEMGASRGILSGLIVSYFCSNVIAMYTLPHC